MTVIPTLAHRATVRSALATLFSTELTGVGKSVAQVTAYPKAQIQGNTPLIVIESVGSMRATSDGIMVPLTAFFLQVHIFVPYVDLTSSWDESDSADRLDEIERDVMGIVALHGDKSNDENASWLYLDITERSRVDIYIEGQEFLHEMIPLMVTAYNTG